MKAGFARIDITPSLGCSMAGGYHKHYATEILTALYANAVAFSDEKTTAAAVSMDLLEMPQYQMDILRKYVSDHTGLPMEALFLSCTHTHSGPDVGGFLFDIDMNYFAVLCDKVSDAVTFAVRDLKEAKASIARTQAEGISAIRRYRMEDGSVVMNPGPVPNATPVGTPDHTVQLVRLVREDAPDIAIVHFQTHPCVVGTIKRYYDSICHDWPGFLRNYLEAALSDEADGKGIHAIFFNGAEGDTNQLIDRFHMKSQFGLTYAKHMARKLTGAVLSIYTYTQEIDASNVFCKQINVYATPKKAESPEQFAESQKIFQLFQEYKGLTELKALLGENTLARTAEAVKHIRLADAPDDFPLCLSVLGFGDVVFVGFPGEPFTEIGRQVKEQSPFTMTIPCCNTNGSEGYFSMRADIESGSGYEAQSARFMPGVAEALIEQAVALTHEMKEKQTKK